MTWKFGGCSPTFAVKLHKLLAWPICILAISGFATCVLPIFVILNLSIPLINGALLLLFQQIKTFLRWRTVGPFHYPKIKKNVFPSNSLAEVLNMLSPVFQNGWSLSKYIIPYPLTNSTTSRGRSTNGESKLPGSGDIAAHGTHNIRTSRVL